MRARRCARGCGLGGLLVGQFHQECVDILYVGLQLCKRNCLILLQADNSWLAFTPYANPISIYVGALGAQVGNLNVRIGKVSCRISQLDE